MSNVLTIKYESELQVLAYVKLLSSVYGCRIRPRGRHSDRKKVLGTNWVAGTQNDIPWRKAERVTFYKLSK